MNRQGCRNTESITDRGSSNQLFCVKLLKQFDIKQPNRLSITTVFEN